MATYVEINGNQYPAVITGRLSDKDWDNRESKAIKIEMSYANALALFVDEVAWNIVQDVEVMHEVENENGEMIHQTVIEQKVYDNSEYSIAGCITDHRDGHVTIKMGKPTANEMLAELANMEYEDMLAMNDVEV